MLSCVIGGRRCLMCFARWNLLMGQLCLFLFWGDFNASQYHHNFTPMFTHPRTRTQTNKKYLSFYQQCRRPNLPVIMWNETHAHRGNPWVTRCCHLSMSFNWCTIESVSIFGGAESKLTDRPWQEAVMVSACWALFIVSPPVTGNDPQLTYKK